MSVARKSSNGWPKALLLALIVAFVLLFQPLVLNQLIPQGHYVTHLRWATQFANGIADGVAYPRWAYASRGGLGDPTFVYYQPLFYYVVSAVKFFAADISQAVRAAILIGNVMLALAAYSVLRLHCSGWRLAVGVSAIQSLPLLFFLAAYYGALPWVFAAPFALLFASESGRVVPRVHWLAVWLALVTLSHVLSALMLLVAIGFSGVVQGVRDRSRVTTYFSRWLAGVGVGLLLCSPYLFPAVTQQHLITPEGWTADPTLDWRRSFAFPLVSYFTYGFRWFALQWPFPLVSAGMAVSALLLARKLPANDSATLARALATFALVGLLLSSELAWPLYAYLPPLERIQQPYRFVTPAMLCAGLSLAIVLSVRPLRAHFQQRPLATACALAVSGGCVLIALLLQIGVMKEGRPPVVASEAMRGAFGQPEYLPATAGPRWREYLEAGGWPSECRRSGVDCSDVVHTSHGWSGRVSANQPVTVRVPLFFYPAWSVWVNEKEVPTQVDRDTGLIRVELPAGLHSIRVSWEGLPAERLGWWMSLLGLFLLAVSIYWRRIRGPIGGLRWFGQFSRFAVVGVVGTIGHYVLLILSVSGLGLSPVVGATMGAALGALINYGLNYRYTFASSSRHAKALPRFLLMAGLGLMANALIVGFLVDVGFHYLAAQVLATGTVLVINFLVSKTWIFRESKG